MKVVCVLYDGGKAANEEPRLFGTTENALGIADWLKQNGHEYVVTSDKEGPNSKFAKEIVDADVYIGTPFHPGYLTRDLIATAKNLKLCITAGVGSDHVDLDACNERKISVCEVSGSNVVAVAEHAIMTILVLLRNFVPAHEQVMAGGWNVADICRFSFDLQNKVVGTIGAGRIGFRVLQRLKPFECKELLYFDYNALPEHAAQEVGVRRVESLEDMVSQCDVITVNCPLHDKTKGLVNKALISKMKKGAILVNTARGAICVAEDVAAALKTGQLGGYGGDVWNVQPAPKDHPWRTARNHLGGGNAMTAHISGSSLDSQMRYANGTKKILENFMTGKPQDPANVIVEKGHYATRAYGQRPTEGKTEVRTNNVSK